MTSFTAFPIPILVWPGEATRLVTSSTTVGINDSVILVNSSTPATISLPDLTSWTSGFYARSVWVKDYGGTAASANITITPFGAQTIDLRTSLVLVSNHAIARLYPVSDLSGWYVA